MSYRDILGDLIKTSLNNLFFYPSAAHGRMSGLAENLDIAAVRWLALEVESYTSIISNRQCERVKAWKSPMGLWSTTMDVDIRLTVSGGIAQPTLDLKIIIRFTGLTCLLQLSDWTTQQYEEVPGRVVRMRGLTKLERISPPSPGPQKPIYDEDEEVPV